MRPENFTFPMADALVLLYVYTIIDALGLTIRLLVKILFVPKKDFEPKSMYIGKIEFFPHHQSLGRAVEQ
jgi:hypothetical protein